MQLPVANTTTFASLTIIIHNTAYPMTHPTDDMSRTTPELGPATGLGAGSSLVAHDTNHTNRCPAGAGRVQLEPGRLEDHG